MSKVERTITIEENVTDYYCDRCGNFIGSSYKSVLRDRSYRYIKGCAICGDIICRDCCEGSRLIEYYNSSHNCHKPEGFCKSCLKIGEDYKFRAPDWPYQNEHTWETRSPEAWNEWLKRGKEAAVKLRVPPNINKENLNE